MTDVALGLNRAPGPGEAVHHTGVLQIRPGAELDAAEDVAGEIGDDAGLVARLAQNGFEHGAGGTFAIGAGHGDDGAVKLQRQALGDGAYAVQAQFDAVDAFGVQALAVGEPVS